MASPKASITHLVPPGRRLETVLSIVAKHADDVDRNARFPQEAFDALKRERLLGILIPRDLGGEGTSLGEIVEMCAVLAQHCASTAMIFAMHHIKVSSLVTHGATDSWHRSFMKEIVESQLLLGSATTEAGIGGDLRNSICAVETNDGHFELTKQASVISYATRCDAILATARRHRDAAGSDQVMVVLKKDQYTLTKTADWDTLGMRGTCSEGFVLQGRAPAEQIFPHPFAEIAAQSMLAMSHLMWAGVWFGIAADAVQRTQGYLRGEARKRPGTTPPGAVGLAAAVAQLQALKGAVLAGVAQYDAGIRDPNILSGIGFSVAMNNVKVTASTSASAIVHACLTISGISAYRNESKFSLCRHMRDVLSAAIMINNDRILGNTANLLLVSKADTRLAV
ncbi:MAG: acyl-CoA dehydrogenase family protein [Beijerinckiaceae bacterium]